MLPKAIGRIENHTPREPGARVEWERENCFDSSLTYCDRSDPNQQQKSV
jgi:hypothetical protein